MASVSGIFFRRGLLYFVKFIAHAVQHVAEGTLFGKFFLPPSFFINQFFPDSTGCYTSIGECISELRISLTFVTDSDNCRQGACDFRTIKLDDVKKDAVRLVYRFKPMSMIIDEEAALAAETEVKVSSDGEKRAKETSLIKLKLKDTGEWFGDPEIYFLALYFKGGKFVRMDTVDIDWAIEKGVNTGNTDLIFWKGTDQVKLVLKERDLSPLLKYSR